MHHRLFLISLFVAASHLSTPTPHHTHHITYTLHYINHVQHPRPPHQACGARSACCAGRQENPLPDRHHGKLGRRAHIGHPPRVDPPTHQEALGRTRGQCGIERIGRTRHRRRGRSARLCTGERVVDAVGAEAAVPESDDEGGGGDGAWSVSLKVCGM
jgi:hypothetical protein